MKRVFKQSQYKFALDCITVFAVAAFFMFFIDYSQIDNIKYITLLEVLGSLGVGFSIAVIYAVIIHSLRKDRFVTVSDNGLSIELINSTREIDFNDIKALDVLSLFFYKISKSVKIRIEAVDFFCSFFIQENQLDEFLNLMPKEVYSDITASKKTCAVPTYFALLLQTSFVFFLFCIFLIPAALHMVKGSAINTVWFAVTLLYILTIVSVTSLHIGKAISYYNFKYTISGGMLTTVCGKLNKRTLHLSVDNITAVCFVQNFISMLFGLRKIKLTTKGGGKGIVENNYFPFLLKKQDAIEIVESLVGKDAANTSLYRPKYKEIAPVLVLWLLPMIAISAISILGSPLFMLLHILVILFIFLTYKNAGRQLCSDIFIQQKGFLNTARYFIPINKIERIDAVQTVTGRIFKMTFIEIYLSGFRAVIFGGYYYKAEYDSLIENINKLS